MLTDIIYQVLAKLIKYQQLKKTTLTNNIRARYPMALINEAIDQAIQEQLIRCQAVPAVGQGRPLLVYQLTAKGHEYYSTLTNRRTG